MSQRFPGTDSAEQQQGDKAVFGKLLKRVIHFPDENFVYLVQGKPVLTFWGFEHAGTGNGDPLHCLYQVPPAFTLPPGGRTACCRARYAGGCSSMVASLVVVAAAAAIAPAFVAVARPARVRSDSVGGGRFAAR